MTGQVPQRIGSLHPNIAPYGELFQTSDGALIILAIGSDRHFVKLCNILGLKDLPGKDEFRHNQNRVRNREQLAVLIAEQTEKLQSSELLEMLHRKIFLQAKLWISRTFSIMSVQNPSFARKLLMMFPQRALHPLFLNRLYN